VKTEFSRKGAKTERKDFQDNLIMKAEGKRNDE